MADVADSWDAEDFEPAPVEKDAVPKDKWEGEDEDENIKDNWFDEDEDSAKSDQPETSTTVTQVKKKKPMAVRLQEKEQKRKKEVEDKQKIAEEAARPQTEEERLDEKLRLRKIQEEADLQLAKEAFGDGRKSKIDFMYPVTSEEFDDFREALREKITVYEKEPVYSSFVENLVRDLCLGLEADDVRKIVNALTVIANEKQKSQKKAKSKAAKSKPKVSQMRDDIGLFDAYTGGGRAEYDEMDDFM